MRHAPCLRLSWDSLVWGPWAFGLGTLRYVIPLTQACTVSGLTSIVGKGGILESSVFRTEKTWRFSDLFIGTGEVRPLIKPSAFHRPVPGRDTRQSACSCPENLDRASVFEAGPGGHFVDSSASSRGLVTFLALSGASGSSPRLGEARAGPDTHLLAEAVDLDQAGFWEEGKCLEPWAKY